MINNDDDSDVYSLFSDSMYTTSLLDSSQTMPLLSLPGAGDIECNDVVSECFDSTAFLSNSISDDIANYNFLEPLMPISMLDDSGNGDPEVPMSSTQVETHPSGSCRSYTYDPSSSPVLLCVVSSSSNPVLTAKPSTSMVSHSADTALSSFAQNIAHDQSPQLNAAFNDELDTADITRRVSEELRRCNISQALFAQAVLGRSQGTLSDLLRKPKPWAQLKSGRETFAKMQQWLMEPEKERLAYLSITGCKVVYCIITLPW